MPVAFHYAARSDTGMVRSDNQDSGYAGPHLLVVADGMGGHAGGDTASSTVIGRIVELDGESFNAADAADELTRAIAAANADLGRLIREQPELEGMGTTVTAILRTRNRLVLAHIGDSRAYLLRGDSFTQLTHDHSFVQTLVDEGRITEEEALSHPQRSLVTRVLTGQPDDEPDLSAREARPGDRLLICSDGLSGFVAADTIEDLLRQGRPPGATADALVALALRAGAPDNVTVVVADAVDPSRTPPTQPEIVGAASLNRTRRPVSDSPASKAAALTRRDEPALAEETGSSRVARWLKGIGALAAALLVVATGLYAAWSWTQDQYFIGDEGGHVAIYRGVAQDVGPLTLHTVVETSTTSLADLPAFYRDGVRSTINASSLENARERVAELESRAAACRERKAEGQPCGDGQSPAPSSSTSSSTSGSSRSRTSDGTSDGGSSRTSTSTSTSRTTSPTPTTTRSTS
ncbi:PP2C family protein-serine/threonine phosphatase [Janibacter sp. G56]|uniref:PP2C family protein-serine/threonine phosphatase n=1 Tax=Janibacter sp. G56 TaxID=3418717 RepID=UPI003D07D6E1